MFTSLNMVKYKHITVTEEQYWKIKKDMANWNYANFQDYIEDKLIKGIENVDDNVH